MFERWVLTVRADISSALPISLFDFLAATIRAISVSRAVKPAAPLAIVLGGGLTPRSRISSRSAQFVRCSKSREHVVCLSQLTGTFLSLSHFHQRTGETASDSRGLRGKWNCLELVHR